MPFCPPPPLLSWERTRVRRLAAKRVLHIRPTLADRRGSTPSLTATLWPALCTDREIPQKSSTGYGTQPLLKVKLKHCTDPKAFTYRAPRSRHRGLSLPQTLLQRCNERHSTDRMQPSKFTYSSNSREKPQCNDFPPKSALCRRRWDSFPTEHPILEKAVIKANDSKIQLVALLKLFRVTQIER